MLRPNDLFKSRFRNLDLNVVFNGNMQKQMPLSAGGGFAMDYRSCLNFKKKVIIILETVISLFFMFKIARFLLFLGYVARYAPYKK